MISFSSNPVKWRLLEIFIYKIYVSLSLYNFKFTVMKWIHMHALHLNDLSACVKQMHLSQDAMRTTEKNLESKLRLASGRIA